jgi:hypothetical protein
MDVEEVDGRSVRALSCPFAGMTRIRFKGLPRIAESQPVLRSRAQDSPRNKDTLGFYFWLVNGEGRF